MNIYEQRSRKNRFLGDLGNNTLVMLISILLVVFVMFSMVNIFYLFTFTREEAFLHFRKDIYDNLALPGSFSGFLNKPWTLLTYMVYHQDVWHLIGNLLWLWVFGYLLHDLTGNRHIFPIFFYGALGGALAFMLASAFMPGLYASEVQQVNMVGASAGIMAVAIAITVIAPGYRLFPFIMGGIPLWVLTLIFVVIDLALVMDQNSGGHVAHIGGALSGYLYMVFYRRGYDGSTWMHQSYEWLINLFNPDKPSRKAKPVKEQLFYKSPSTPYSKTLNLTQQRVDEILDKIHQKGYDSLSAEEKELLKRASKDL